MRIKICVQQQEKSKRSISKSTLSAYYNVDRATLNKWLRFFLKNETNFKNRRKFTNSEVTMIKERLGTEPQSFWKKDLVEIAGTDYKTIRDNIRLFPMVYGMTENEYRSLSKFPPTIAQRIIDGLW
jgi:hypothetical protein